MLTTADIMRFLQPIKIKLMTVVGRAVLLAVDNSGDTQRLRVQFTADEIVERLERLQPYGLETVPTVEDTSEVVYHSIGGQRGLTFVTLVQARALRPVGLAAGEVQLYTKFGQKIHLKADGSIEVTTTGDAVVNCKKLTATATGNVKVDAGVNAVELDGGTLTLKGTAVNLRDVGGNAVMLDTIISLLNNHKHVIDTPVGISGTMSAAGTTLVAGTDSAANVKAKTG